MSKKKIIKVLVVEPGKNPELREIDSSLESMQKIVGGYIQAVPLATGGSLVCDDEGKLKRYPPNRYIAELEDMIAGTFFLASRQLSSLTKGQIAFYTEKFKLTK